jgi:hypothetical protein
MNTGKNMIHVALLILVSACLLCSGCFIMGGDHFLWF